jgi:hypothetical protein
MNMNIMNSPFRGFVSLKNFLFPYFSQNFYVIQTLEIGLRLDISSRDVDIFLFSRGFSSVLEPERTRSALKKSYEVFPESFCTQNIISENEHFLRTS